MQHPRSTDLPVPTGAGSLHVLEQVLAASRDVISLVDVDGTCLYVSPSCESLLGYAPADLVGLDAFAHVLPEDASIAADALERLVRTGRPVMAQFRMVRRSGESVWVEASAQPPEPGETSFGVGIRDVTERKEMEALLTLAALHDPVTGLPNRRLLDTELAAAVARAERSLSPLAVVFVDVDDFKALNDELGHLGGDDVLRSVSDRLRSSVRAGDLAARYGGDEFVVVMHDVVDTQEVEALARRVQERIAQPHQAAGQEVHVAASVGIAVWQEARTAEQLLQEADAAMYAAKSSRRGHRPSP